MFRSSLCSLHILHRNINLTNLHPCSKRSRKVGGFLSRKYEIFTLVCVSEPVDPSEWDIEETISNISFLDPTLGPHVECFKTHEIDGKLLPPNQSKDSSKLFVSLGKALLLLSSDMMMKYLDLKLGPALKICNIIDKLKGRKHLPIG